MNRAKLNWCGSYVVIYDAATNADLKTLNLTKRATVSGKPGQTVQQVAESWCVENGYILEK